MLAVLSELKEAVEEVRARYGGSEPVKREIQLLLGVILTADASGRPEQADQAAEVFRQAVAQAPACTARSWATR
ncbi:hypothetical protein AB0B45_32180 [Nonomuraea sp. NPDC049152]|uniref:hypothetical protein n=1 Tax=Nonomuraea sp. NPDC049152 TaxID=3154350 RepID=UPI0033DBEFF1